MSVAVRAVVRALKAADNPVVGVNDGEAIVKTPTEGEVMQAACAVDFASLITRSGRSVAVVPDEDPADQIVDYHESLDPIIAPVIDRFNG